jgi:hypothetical protein
MTREHLSDWEIEEALICSGPHRESGGHHAQQHLESCGFCKSKEERLRQALILYRDAALLQSDLLARGEAVGDSEPERETAAPPMIPYGVHSYGWGLVRLGLALFLLLAVLIPFFIQHRREHHAAQMAKDNLLLEKVDRAVNASVPRPLQSLTNLVVASEYTSENGDIDEHE